MTDPLTNVREISRLAYGFMASKALFAALNLELFGHISKGEKTIDALSVATGIATHRLETLVAALVSSGVLVRDGKHLANASATDRYLVPGATAYFGDYYRFQIGGQIYPNMNSLDAGLRGDEDGLAHANVSGWLSDPKQAEDFSLAQHAGSLGPAMMMAKALDLSSARTLLDVGGGTGAYTISFCKKNPELNATIIDFPAVTAIANRYIEDASLGDRVSLVSGDARATPWPDGQGYIADVLSSECGWRRRYTETARQSLRCTTPRRPARSA